MSDETEIEYEPRDELREVSCTGGGPLDGKVLTLRKTKGFLAILKESDRVWLYDLAQDEDAALCREAIGVALDRAALKKAVDEWHYDIIAVEIGEEAAL